MVAKSVGSVSHASWKVSYTYTTNSISGSVGGTPRYFELEQEVLSYYLGLKNKSIALSTGEMLTGVTLERAIGWQHVLGGES